MMFKTVVPHGNAQHIGTQAGGSERETRQTEALCLRQLFHIVMHNILELKQDVVQHHINQ